MKSQADLFINRELSWIKFNKRVLLTGMEKEYKILDKVKFCSIFSNNLDEFFMVRVASLKAQVEAGITKKSIDGLTPKEQLKKINRFIQIPNEIIKYDDESTFFFISVEDLIGNNINTLFNGMECINYSFFRVTRDADLELSLIHI